MNNPKLWQPSEQRIERSQMAELMRRAQFETYEDLYAWSIQDLNAFWKAVAEFSRIQFTHEPDQIAPRENTLSTHSAREWFAGAQLNYAQHLLRNPDNTLAVLSYTEEGQQASLTRHELYQEVAKAQAWLIDAGVQQNTVVAAVLPNVPQAIVFMLATTALGAIWTACSPDFGVPALVDRFNQVSPRVLIVSPGYLYKGKWIDCTEKNTQLAQALNGLMQTWNIADPLPATEKKIQFESLSFDHPAFILYSSGTTGMPKCIVHGHGGTLIQHMKELILHTDLGSGDRLFYMTTCAWMMWNWMVSALGTGAAVVLYEGCPLYPQTDALFKVLEDAQITVFGTSAKFLSTWQKEGVKALDSKSFARVKTILSTGSPLLPDTFKYVYENIKQDVCLSSIAGGTDLISCFALGCPLLPVYQGELQCRGLGMAVEIWNEKGEAVVEEKGELVCVKPFPSMPVKFWNDPKELRYQKSYFDRFENVWTHGDYAMLKASCGIVIFGRSDAVLNPGGVRIGTAEIYRQVETLPTIAESLAIGFQHQDTQDIILFVIMVPGEILTEPLITEIKHKLRQNASPRHVPTQIIAVKDFPRTFNGKVSELAVTKIFNREPLDNVQALANPEILDIFRSLRETHIIGPL